MSIFGLGNSGGCGCSNTGMKGEECILAHKIYDQCRLQICLTPSILGSAKAAETRPFCGEVIQEDEVIVPPANAASVTAEHLRLKKIFILSKCPNPFRPGYWDIEVSFLFVYRLVFRTSDNVVIDRIWAQSTYKTKVTLFGSIGTDIVMACDMYTKGHDAVNCDPFVCVEGKAVALAAELKYCSICPTCCANNCGCNNGCNNCGNNGNCCDNCSNCCEEDVSSVPVAVLITIGLFAIIKVIRLVNIMVHSSGCCMPEECPENNALSAGSVCDVFDNMEFPIDIFCPPWGGCFQGDMGNECGCYEDDSNLSGGNSSCGCGNECGSSCGDSCGSCGGETLPVFRRRGGGNSCGCGR